MTTEGIDVSAENGVLRLRLDRPERKNSLTQDAIVTLVRALEAAQTDESLRVVLIDSSGDDFCVGADIRAANPEGGTKPRTGSIQRRTSVQAHRLIEILTTVQLPVVCAVRGWAAGIGCQIALAADFTVAADDAVFWEPFVTKGFTPDSGATWLLPRLVGVARAKEMLMLGEKVSGEQAAQWGMIHRAVPVDDLDATAAALVERLSEAATVAVGLTKAAVQGALESSLTEAMAREALSLELSSRSEDFREGLAAFKERRDPGYRGR